MDSDSFWAKIKVGAHDECWPYQGYINEDGYGVIGRPKQRAHRRAYEERKGPIPRGLLICHSCDNRACCNPAHLFPGTKQVNSLDMWAKNRGVRGIENGMALLTEQQVKDIRADTRTQMKIAANYGISQSLVSIIKARKRWAHVK